MLNKYNDELQANASSRFSNMLVAEAQATQELCREQVAAHSQQLESRLELRLVQTEDKAD